MADQDYSKNEAKAERCGEIPGPAKGAEIFTLDEKDKINLKLGEALAMAEVLAGHNGDHVENLQTYCLMLHERLDQASRLFNKK